MSLRQLLSKRFAFEGHLNGYITSNIRFVISQRCNSTLSKLSSNKIQQIIADMSPAPKYQMNNGLEMPALGLGTWQSAPGEVEAAVKLAIEVGYRHIDCAMVYDNEHEIGTGIKEVLDAQLVKREDLFIATKLWNTFHKREQVVDTCKKSLENFGLSYVDLYLVHWPVAQETKGPFTPKFPFKDAVGIDYDYVDTWKGMEECVKLGLAKSIGISNFNAEQIDNILKNCTIKPVTNQIEVNLFNNEKKMIDYCRKRNIIVTAYSPFSSPTRPWAKADEPKLDWKDPKLVAIAQKHGKTVGQILLRHLIQLGTVPIPKSVNKQRLRENLEIFDFKLTEDEMKVIDGFNRNFRAVKAPELIGLPHYPFDNWI